MFADLKYTSTQKDESVIIIDCKGDLAEQHIAGILGLRMDNGYRVTPTTKSIVRITLLKSDR